MQQQLPAALLASLQAVKGFDEKAFVEVHQSGAQVVSIRYNPQKDAAIKKEGNKVPWSSEGYYLNERPSFTLDPLFHAGAYYVQEASSMFLEEAIRQCCDISLPLSVLDLCAAPGGKSTLIQSIISAESILVSNEIIKTRVNILAENIVKWGAANVVVTNNNAKDFQRLPAFFDLIVIDAPCSGSGLFRKDNDAITEWSPNNVELCSQRQQRILADIMPALKPGGVLIYSTCSYSEKEDEAIADWLTESFNLKSIALNIDKNLGIVETNSPQHNCNGYRFYPDKIKGEGFFIAAFKNEQELKSYKELKPKTKLQPLNKAEIETVRPYLKNDADLTFVKWQDDVLAIPSAIYEKVVSLQAALYLKKAGVKLGSIIRTELIPDHELAVSTIISEKINRIEADLATALEYLRKKDIFLETDKKSWAILTYKELPLGLIKILSGRINNYYPKEWRILNK
ncbi:MAG: RNA methyltransferase [Ferruginibacter sp.]